MDTPGVKHIPADHLTTATAQTPGMQRFAAVSASTVGAQALFMGQTTVAPGATSGPHHHGPSETAIYVVSGRPVFHYREGDRVVTIEAHPGDYVFVPPFAPHIEANPAGGPEAVVVVARSTQEAIVENLESL